MIAGLVPPVVWRWLAIAGVALVVLVGLAGAYEWWAGKQRAIGRGQVEALWNVDKARQARAALEQAEANAKETKRRLERQSEIQHESDSNLAAARRDAAAARAAAGGLREWAGQLAERADRCDGASHSAIGLGRAPAAGAGALLANVLERADEAAGELAEYADAARIAGEQCERAYDALTKN